MEEITEIAKIAAPYGKEIEFFNVEYENGFKMLRVRIREGKRFTMLDLDPETAKSWGQLMQQWAAE